MNHYQLRKNYKHSLFIFMTMGFIENVTLSLSGTSVTSACIVVTVLTS